MIEPFKTRRRIPDSVIEDFERMEGEMDTLRNETAELDDRIDELASGAPDAGTLREMLSPFMNGMAALSLEQRKAVIHPLIGEIRVDRFEPETGENDDYQRRGDSRIGTGRLLLDILLNARTPVEDAVLRVRLVTEQAERGYQPTVRAGSRPTGPAACLSTIPRSACIALLPVPHGGNAPLPLRFSCLGYREQCGIGRRLRADQDASSALGDGARLAHLAGGNVPLQLLHRAPLPRRRRF